MPTLQNNWAAYWWSLIALLPLVMTAASDLHQHWPAADHEHKDIFLAGVFERSPGGNRGGLDLRGRRGGAQP